MIHSPFSAFKEVTPCNMSGTMSQISAYTSNYTILKRKELCSTKNIDKPLLILTNNKMRKKKLENKEKKSHYDFNGTQKNN